MKILVIIFLALIVASLGVGLYALFAGKSQMLKWSLTVRIALSVAVFAIFVVYTLWHYTDG